MNYISLIILGIIIIIYFTKLNNFNTSNELINYELRAFYHADTQHLIANCVSLFGLSFMEKVIGWEMFLAAILFIWLVSGILLYMYHQINKKSKVYTVGFSAVIYGLIVVYIFSLIKNKKQVKSSIAGLIIGIIPQFFMSQISVAGHICGIIAGLIFSFFVPINYNKQALDNMKNPLIG